MACQVYWREISIFYHAAERDNGGAATELFRRADTNLLWICLTCPRRGYDVGSVGYIHRRLGKHLMPFTPSGSSLTDGTYPRDANSLHPAKAGHGGGNQALDPVH